MAYCGSTTKPSRAQGGRCFTVNDTTLGGNIRNVHTLTLIPIDPYVSVHSGNGLQLQFSRFMSPEENAYLVSWAKTANPDQGMPSLDFRGTSCPRGIVVALRTATTKHSQTVETSAVLAQPDSTSSPLCGGPACTVNLPALAPLLLLLLPPTPKGVAVGGMEQGEISGRFKEFPIAVPSGVFPLLLSFDAVSLKLKMFNLRLLLFELPLLSVVL